MEKRMLVFLVLAILVVVGNTVIMNVWFPPKPKPVAVQPDQADAEGEGKIANDAAAEVAGSDNDSADPNAKPTDKPADEDGAQPAVEPAADAEARPEMDPAVPAEEPAAADEPPLAFYTLGSVDPASPFRMLVTFTNRGAAIERLELSNRRFSDLDDRSGYLGELSATSAPDGGALVRVVGAGTPAAQAGLKAGDVIVSLDSAAVKSAEELRQLLSGTKPGQNVELGVSRDGAKPNPLTAQLIRRPLAVMRPERENILSRRETIPKDFKDPPSLLLTLEQVGERALEGEEGELKGLHLRDGNWQLVEQSATAIVFRQVLPKEQLTIDKRYELAKVPGDEDLDEAFPAYHLTLGVEIRNTGSAERQVAFRLDGPTGLPTEGWWFGSKISRNWSGGAGVRDVIGWWYENPAPLMFSATTVADGGAEAVRDKPLMYMGVDAQYFSAVLMPQTNDVTQVWFQEAKSISLSPTPDARTNKMLTNVTTRMTSIPQTLAAGEQFKREFRLFAGPKRPELLKNYYQPKAPSYTLSELVYFGWPLWAGVAKVMLGILHFLYNIVQNYGIAIVMLTVLVRGAMFPLSRKQALNMIKMQELQPEIKKLQEKYKKDLQERQKAQSELFRKHNYNPMGGCLLVFLQLPVFLGLYRSLMVDIELRQAPLFGHAIRWCSNLAAPDMLYDWSGFMPEWINSGVGMFALGPYFNLLPLLTIGLFILQQKMFMPPAVDEQQIMQQKMMKYMMVFMGVMFYKVASGLCLYFIASSLWGIGERKLLPKPAPQTGPEGIADAAPEPVRISTNGSAKNSKGKTKQRKR